MNGFLREAIGDFKRYVLVPLFFGMSAGVGICLGRVTYFKLEELCGRLFVKSIYQAFLEWYKLKLKT